MNYKIFVEQLSGQTFVEDLDVVTMKLAILNERMSASGELSANDYYNLLDLDPRYEDVRFTVLKGMIFQFRPTFIGGVPVIAIGVEKIEWDDIDSKDILHQDEELEGDDLWW